MWSIRFENYLTYKYDRIVENVSNVTMCRNCKVTYKGKFLAYDVKCSLGKGLHKDALGYERQSAQVSTFVLSFPNSRMVKCQCHYY